MGKMAGKTSDKEIDTSQKANENAMQNASQPKLEEIATEQKNMPTKQPKQLFPSVMSHKMSGNTTNTRYMRRITDTIALIIFAI